MEGGGDDECSPEEELLPGVTLAFGVEGAHTPPRLSPP
jgi:hypothetical protein